MATPRERLARVVHTTPIIDNHAHPLLTLDAIGRYPLLAVTTEAHGDAIHDAMTSLAHVRGVAQLARLHGCAPTWEAVVDAVEARRLGDYAAYASRCLAGIDVVLVDDGLDGPDDVYPYGYFDRLTGGGGGGRARARRIVRVEMLAQQIIEGECLLFEPDEDGVVVGAVQDAQSAFQAVLDAFSARIRRYVEDPEVAGFKSIICYRTGLDVPPRPDVQAAFAAFSALLAAYRQPPAFAAVVVGRFVHPRPTAGSLRLQHPGLNELFVHRAAQLIRDTPPRSGGNGGTHHRKPLQFHTGLGDSDITLSRASPAHLQPFIRAYPEVPVVLLHAGYPFTREAGYLATVYPNAYLDVGEVFPFVGQDGQERVVREALELCPWSKILWSTDGHWFPETYYLAVEQVREVLDKVLCEYCQKGYLTWKQAEHVVKDIFFNNSNKLYRLGLKLEELPYDAPQPPRRDVTNRELLSKFLLESAPPPGSSSSGGNNNASASSFLRVNWTDFTAMPRTRVMPMRRAATLLDDDDALSIGITKASLGLLQNDLVVPGISPAGEYRLHPDFFSLRVGPVPGHVSAWGEFREADGSVSPLCPRSLLTRVLAAAAAEQGLTFQVGFEIELLLLARHVDAATGRQTYRPLATDGHAWSVAAAMDADPAMRVVERAVLDLAALGIHVEQFHPESAPGQYEVVLPRAPPLEAVETLLHARAPFARACGTAAHAHLSIASSSASPHAGGGGASGGDGDDPRVYGAFYAGILRRLRSILAITYSNPASYERAVDGAWAGGRWVCWGTQNREAPLRKVAASHWELKCLDGLANPYFALAAVIGAGMRGVADGETLVWGDCEVDPASLSANDRLELGIRDMLPASLPEALEALEGDGVMREVLGEAFVERYGAVKRAEMKFLEGMDDAERRQWIMERY